MYQIALSSGLYEKLCVLFNIGACCSEIAASAQLDQEEGLKTAAKLYQQAAGCFSFIRDNSLSATRSDCTLDFYPDALSLLISIMLAQAQEIFYIKSVDNKFKDGTIAKLAKQTSDYYADAMKAVQVESMSSQKSWLATLAGKQALFHALSEYHRGEHDATEHKVGEALARFTKAMELIKTAELRAGKELNLKQYTARIQTSYEKTKKDNEFVYHDRVPDFKTLPAIEPASLAKVTPIKYPISEDFRGWNSGYFSLIKSCFYWVLKTWKVTPHIFLQIVQRVPIWKIITIYFRQFTICLKGLNLVNLLKIGKS